LKVLSDDTKRKEYDTWGSTSEQMGMGGGGGRRGGPGAGMGQGFGGGWNFSSNVDPEELFRKIFGEAGFKTGFGDYEDFAESHFGYGAAQEVYYILVLFLLNSLINWITLNAVSLINICIFQVIMNLTFAHAARGVNKDINVNVVDTCPKCSGSKCELGTKAIECPACNGTGMETVSTGIM
jgi:DnaJ homolog subfamily A member 3